MIEARPVADDGELEQILDLQRRNLARNLSEREMAESGFVTVEHTLDLLRRMHALVPGIVAKDGAELAGYALVMPVECRSFIPVLEPMFQRLEALGAFRRFLGITSDERVHVEAGGAERAEVRDAAEAGADDRHPGHTRLRACGMKRGILGRRQRSDRMGAERGVDPGNRVRA